MYFQKIGCGEVVVFLHGWGCDGSVFNSVVSNLKGCCSYLPDFNGFGKSPLPPQSGWGVENYADALWLFFKHHNIEKACIVAHSFGCRVALVFAAKYPNLVRKMMLVAPAGLRKPSLTRRCKVCCFKMRKFLAKLGGRTFLNESFGSVDYKNCTFEMKNTFVKVVNQDLSGFAKKVSCLTLIVCGKSDKETPVPQCKRLCALIPHCQLVEIEGGHFAFFATPKAFASTIEYFVGAKF